MYWRLDVPGYPYAKNMSKQYRSTYSPAATAPGGTAWLIAKMRVRSPIHNIFYVYVFRVSLRPVVNCCPTSVYIIHGPSRCALPSTSRGALRKSDRSTSRSTSVGVPSTSRGVNWIPSPRVRLIQRFDFPASQTWTLFVSRNNRFIPEQQMRNKQTLNTGSRKYSWAGTREVN